MDLNLVRILFTVASDQPDLHLAGFYQTLRHFDRFFRDACCQRGAGECHDCPAQSACPYRDVFAQELSTDPEIVRRHQKPPLPFAFKVSVVPDDSSSLELDLVIVGSAINHLPVFSRAVRRLIEAVPGDQSGPLHRITETYCVDYQSVRHKLDCSGHGAQNLVVLSSLEIIRNTAGADRVRVILESPLRMLSGGSVLHGFDFTVFLRTQLRRCSSLFAYYGEGELELDFAGLSSAANHVRCLNDRTRYQQPCWSQRPNQAGLLGLSEFSHVGPGMLPLLTLGSYLNAGKGSSYGLGAYSVGELAR